MTPLVDALRWSPPALHLQAAWSRWRRRGRSGERTRGSCPVCEHTTVFTRGGDNLREEPVCARCGSVPRHRALLRTLAAIGVDAAAATAGLRVHAASPSLAVWRFWRRHCRALTVSMWLPDTAPGARVGTFVSADLQRQPFADGAFDLVVTEDVLEHVPDPDRALREIQRTLRPGGRHVFTVPRHADRPTVARAELRDGAWRHLLPPEYHHDPSTRRGALVVTDWGEDLEARVAAATGAACERHVVTAPAHGVPAAIEVFAVQRIDSG